MTEEETETRSERETAQQNATDDSEEVLVNHEIAQTDLTSCERVLLKNGSFELELSSATLRVDTLCSLFKWLFDNIDSLNSKSPANKNYCG